MVRKQEGIMFIVKKAVKDYVKKHGRRTSKEFLMYLEVKVHDTIESFLKANSKITLKP
jgi:hypothetical protein